MFLVNHVNNVFGISLLQLVEPAAASAILQPLSSGKLPVQTIYSSLISVGFVGKQEKMFHVCSSAATSAVHADTNDERLRPARHVSE